MYIAIEGIKGSGKSTIIDKLAINSSYSMKQLELFPMTAPIYPKNRLERLVSTGGIDGLDDSTVEKLFIERAYWHQANLVQRNGLVFGDRCIATACVTRWLKWEDPYVTLERVKEQYKGIMIPDVVIWIKTDLETAVSRISKRRKISVRSEDEKTERLSMAIDSYDQLFRERLFHKKIRNIQLVQLENRNIAEETCEEIYSILNFYRKS